MRRKRMLILLIGVPAAVLLVLAGMIAFGTAAAPPPLASVYDSVQRMDMSALPPLQRYTARDGAALAYRIWPGGGQRVAMLIHGSTASSRAMNPLAKALAADGVTVYAPDMRGHGESGRNRRRCSSAATTTKCTPTNTHRCCSRCATISRCR